MLSFGGRLIGTLRATRNSLIASPVFQRWAFRLPVARNIARRQANDLFDIVAGFVYSQVLYACVELDVFERLDSVPLSVADFAKQANLPARSARVLLNAAAALQLADEIGEDLFILGRHGAALKAHPWLYSMVKHHKLLYRDLEDPVVMLRNRNTTGHLAAFWPYAEGGAHSRPSAQDAENYSRLMAQSQAAIANDVIDSYPFARHEKVLDVGGGEGAFLETLLTRETKVRGMIFELPEVAARAEARLSQAGLMERVSIHAGSFLTESWPAGAALITLIRVLHDHDDEKVEQILCGAHNSLKEKGVLLIAEPMAGTAGAEPSGAAYFGFYLHAMGSGRPRRKTELVELLNRAGFTHIREHPTPNPMMVRVLTARPAGRL